MTLRCTAEQQPWASLLVSGVKDVENRNSAMPATLVGQWCAIYASRTLAPVGSWHYAMLTSGTRWPYTVGLREARKQCTRGAIVGLVRWRGSTTGKPKSPWANPGMHHWTYSDRIALANPVPLPDGGYQSLTWRLSDDTVFALMTAIANSGYSVPDDVLRAYVGKDASQPVAAI